MMSNRRRKAQSGVTNCVKEGGGAEHGKNRAACFSQKQNWCGFLTTVHVLCTHTPSTSSCIASAAVRVFT